MLQQPEVQQAGIVGALVVAVGLALLSRLLFKPKQPSQVVRDDKPNTAHLRGSFIPLVIGRRRVGAVILDVWGRETEIETEEVGGKGGGGGSTIQKTIYYEKACHALCVGPAAQIKGIYKDGEKLPGSGDINSLQHPSGTAITFSGFGTARIYWGERNQPKDSVFNQRLGINTRMPYVCYVVWDRARLGGTPRWPIIEYEVKIPGDMASGPVNNPTVNGGVNPAQVFWQLATALYPHGAGLNPAWISYAAVSDMGDLASSESIGFNMLVQDGDPVDRIISEMMQDFGFLLSECNGVISPYAIRKETESVQLLDDTLLLPPIEEIENVHISPLGNALVYEYNDEDQNYHTATIDVDDDSISSIRNQRRTKKIQLATVTRRNVANKIVNRRQIEDLDNATRIKAKGLRGLRLARPGQAFDLPGVGRVRMLGFQLDFNAPNVTLDLLRDPFNQDIIDYVDPDLPGQTPPGDLEPHLRFGVFEVPWLGTGGATSLLAVLHHRDNQSIFSSNVWVSADNTTYFQSGVQAAPATGGVLDADWIQVGQSCIVENGPTMTIDENDDENDVPLNLSGDEASWRAGSQFMVINGELMYVREFVQVAGTQWQAKGVIRSRLLSGHRIRSHTYAENSWPRHMEGDFAFIIPQGNVSLQSHSLIETSGARYVKAQPSNDQGTLPLAAIVPNDQPMKALGTKVPPFPWYTAGGDYGYFQNGGYGGRRDTTYMAGGDPFMGGYDENIVVQVMKPAKSGGAGTQGAGVPTIIEEYPDAQCTLRIKVYYEGIANTYEELDQLGEDALKATWEFNFTTATKVGNVYHFTITRAMIDALPNHNDQTDEIGEAGPGDPWRWLMYFDNGAESEPVELRLRDTDFFISFGARNDNVT